MVGDWLIAMKEFGKGRKENKKKYKKKQLLDHATKLPAKTSVKLDVDEKEEMDDRSEEKLVLLLNSSLSVEERPMRVLF